MPFRTFADPDQISIMTQALDLYCERKAIADKEEREELASMVITLFTRGSMTVEEITAGLEQMRGSSFRSSQDDQHAP